jgi:hypothetical protein
MTKAWPLSVESYKCITAKIVINKKASIIVTIIEAFE